MRNISVLILLLMIASPATAAPSLEQYYYNSANLYDPPAEEAMPAVPAPEVTAPSVPVPAAEATGGGSHVVTSVKSCFKEIGAAAAAEIRRTSLTPYADCQRVLRQQAAEAAAEKAEATPPPPAETPRNFRRVTDPDMPEESAEKPAKDKTAPARSDKKTK